MSDQENTLTIETTVESTDGAAANWTVPESSRTIIESRNLTVSYGQDQALRSVDLKISSQQVTAIIGPSGCGKSTFLRCVNRMNDLVDAATIEGELRFDETDIYGDDIDPVALRRRIGMVFQHPNPFPKSIYDNVAYGLRIQGITDDMDDRVEQALKRAALWDEVEDQLDKSALDLSGGQQQRLCIARAMHSRCCCPPERSSALLSS